MNLEDLARSIIAGRSLIPKLKKTTDDELFNEMGKLSIQDNDLVVVIEEILINAREHGKKNINIYLAKILDYLYVAISDAGPGIHNTIPLNIHLSDTRAKKASALIRLACEEGITGTGVKGRGVGLFLFSDFCEKRQAEGLILSDSGILFKNQNLYFEKNTDLNIQGTLVCLKVKL